jgi:hypothetical protein
MCRTSEKKWEREIFRWNFSILSQNFPGRTKRNKRKEFRISDELAEILN